MSDSNDDLEGRQLVLLLVFFVTVGAGLFLIGWLTRLDFLADPVTCAAIAGTACFPARFLAERFSWWSKLAPYTTRVTAEPDTQRALRRVRRQVLKDRIRIVFGGLAILLAFTLVPLEIMGEGHPRKVFTDRLNWTWTDSLILAAVCAVTAAVAALPFFGTVRFSRHARRTLGRAVTATVTLIEIDAKPGIRRPAYLTFEGNDQIWRLAVDSFDPTSLVPGTEIPLTGALEPRGWTALLTNPPLLPAAKLGHRNTAS